MSTTETCFCGKVQVAFSIEGDDLVNTFVCNCLDCRKLTASMFASNFTIKDKSLKYIRGEDVVKTFAMTKTIESGNTMTNTFCGNCGSLMWRVSSGFPGMLIMRIGQVDDLELHETKLKPQMEHFCKDRVAWFKGAEGAEHYKGNYFMGDKSKI